MAVGLHRVVLLGAACIAAVPCACTAPRRYAKSAEVRQSAERAVIVGTVHCEDLWHKRGLGEVRVELLVAAADVPIAATLTNADGAFSLSSPPLEERPARLRVSGPGWEREEFLPGPADESYSAEISILCQEGQPSGTAVLAMTLTRQPIPLSLMTTTPPGQPSREGALPGLRAQ